MCQYLPYLPTLRIWVLLTALFVTLKEQDTVPVRWRRKSTNCSCKLRSCRYSYRAYPGSKIASKRFPRQWPRMMRRSRILNKWLAALQPVLPHWKRMRRPSPVDLARQDLGISSDIAMAPQPLGLSGPMAQGHLMTIEIQDEDLIHSQAPKINKQSRSAVLLRFPCEQYHKEITKWIDNLWEESNLPAYNKPVRIHCKAGSVSVRLVFETRAKCQDFVTRYKDAGIPYSIKSLLLHQDKFRCPSIQIS